MSNNKNIEGKSPFKVPDLYFETLPDKLSEKIKHDKASTSYKRTFDIFKPYIYMAAALLALTFLMKTGLEFVTDNNATSEPINSELSYDISMDIIEHILADDYIFYDYLADADTYSSEISLSSEELEEYILELDNIEYELYSELIE